VQTEGEEKEEDCGIVTGTLNTKNESYLLLVTVVVVLLMSPFDEQLLFNGLHRLLDGVLN